MTETDINGGPGLTQGSGQPDGKSFAAPAAAEPARGLDPDHGTGVDDRDLWFALSTLQARYWRDIDFNAGRGAHEFYQPAGVFIVGKNRFEGADSIKTFYAWRARNSQSVTRHLVSNLLVTHAQGTEATLVGMMNLHRSDALASGARAVAPILVADFVADCVRGEDGRWRFACLSLNPIFVSGDVPLSLAVDPSYLSPRSS